MRRLSIVPRRKVARLAFTADSSALFTAQPGVGVALRDRTDGREIRRYPRTCARRFHRLAPSPCGRWLAVVQSGSVELFSIGGERRWSLNTKYAYCLLVAWDGDDLLIGGGREGLLRLKAAEGTGGRALVLAGERLIVKGLSPCGRWAVGCRRAKPAVLVEVSSGGIRGEVRGLRPNDPLEFRDWANSGLWPRYADATRPADFDDPAAGLVGYGSPLGEAILAEGGRAFVIWDLANATVFDGRATAGPLTLSGRLEVRYDVTRRSFRLSPGGGRVRVPVQRLPRLAFVPDGRTLLFVTPAWRVQRRDWTTGGVVDEWEWPLRMPTCLAVSPDGHCAAAGDVNGRVVVWDLD
jgi:hypothetical protein